MLLDHKFHRTQVWVCFIVTLTSWAVSIAYLFICCVFLLCLNHKTRLLTSTSLLSFVTVQSSFKLTILQTLKGHKTRFDHCPSRGKLGTSCSVWYHPGPSCLVLPLQVQGQGNLLETRLWDVASCPHSATNSLGGNEQVSKQGNVHLVCNLKIVNKNLND